jgi:hypothetical protein
VRGDAQRLAQQADLVAGQEGDGLAVHLVGGGAVELEVARQHLDVVARGAIGLPVSRASRVDSVKPAPLAELPMREARIDRAARLACTNRR